MSQQLFTPSECLALLAVFSDACREVDLLVNIGKQNFPEQNALGSRCPQANADTLLTELNKIFFQTLLRYEKARKEDYLELPDGTFRKLNDEESIHVKYLEIVSRVAATLKALLLEIDETGTITALEKYCNQEQAELEKLETFVSSAAEKEKSLALLQEDVQLLQREIQNDTMEYTNTIENLKHEFQELREMAAMTLQYKSKEYAMRLQQEICRQNSEMKELNNRVENAKAVIAQVTRVAEETNTWLYTCIAKRSTLAEFIPINEHSAVLAEKVKLINAKLGEKKTLHAELVKQYNECDAICLADEREKEGIQLREEYAKKFILAVVQIQSWWRAIIEMRGIRTRKKKKGRKGGKKKKG
ncbi:hypothetical protein FGIG_05721 [Fasciola gigantica]|uniref:Uncharacterized protein n=1 Tax=Fasciola gigantica TaxID=46835 RepID=A0A504YW37_FASGI|nr:hypothetical protein FGIG_05721 [Fasciola gigantica]